MSNNVTISHESSAQLKNLRSNNDLNKNYLPGVEAIGAGYNIFGRYASADSITVQLFDWQNLPTKSVIFKPDYVIPEMVDAQQSDEANYTNVSGKSISKFQKDFSTKVKVSGSYNLFSGSISHEYSTSSVKNAENEFIRIQQSLSVWSLRLAYTDKLRNYLKENIRNYIDNADFDDIFDRYGSHFLVGIVMGGSAIISYAIKKSSMDQSSSTEFAAEASYKGLTGQLNAEAKVKYEDSIAKLEQNSEFRSFVVGGDGVAASKAFVNTKDKSNFDVWKDTVGDSPDFVDFVDSYNILGIWELCEDQRRKESMKAHFEEVWAPRKSKAAEIHVEIPEQTHKCIDSIAVISGNNSSISAPDGYTKDSYDLNKGAGGKYIYLCYHQAPYSSHDTSKKCITDITFVTGKNATAPYGYTKIDTDLNKGAGGKYIYLCYKEADYNPAQAIEDLRVVGGSDSNTPAPYGYQRIPVDLNKGAGGDYIYLCYKEKGLSCENDWLSIVRLIRNKFFLLLNLAKPTNFHIIGKNFLLQTTFLALLVGASRLKQCNRFSKSLGF